MSINWQHLRTWNGSQHSAFEELCCQLAGSEPEYAAESTFIRKGVPDAGVECYWTLPTGEEHVWQAKFFCQSPDAGQWGQIDKSIETALKAHPRMVRYVVCLPVDRADGRRPGETSFLDKWNERVAKWQGWASDLNRTIVFDYWGEHEVVSRLGRAEHDGRYLFWFNREVFSSRWFTARAQESIADAGERYSAVLNVELPVARLFDGLGRTPEFRRRFRGQYGRIRRLYRDLSSVLIRPETRTKCELLLPIMDELLAQLESAPISGTDHLPLSSIASLAERSRSILYKHISDLESARKVPDQEGNSDNNWQRGAAYKLVRELEELEEVLESQESQLTNVPALLLSGDAGSGKTHLFCDVAERRLRRNEPTVLILGQKFAPSEPWHQIIRLLMLSCRPEEFLGALNAAGEARQAKSLLLIDALNEGEGRGMWPNFLAGFLALIGNYPWVGLAISVRSSYAGTIIPEHLSKDALIRARHEGFADQQFNATKAFLDANEIMAPAVPPLFPEFRNPLFLKLFCRGIKLKGLKYIPKGYYGISMIFGGLVDAVNSKLSSESVLDYDSRQNVVQEALEAMAGAMAQLSRPWLFRTEAQKITSTVFQTSGGYRRSLFWHLISEGLLAEDQVFTPLESTGETGYAEVVRFTYERFGDHLTVRQLLKRHLDNTEPDKSFFPEAPLGQLVRDKTSIAKNQGLVEALCIQLPETLGRELSELAPKSAEFDGLKLAFIQSLTWRRSDAFFSSTDTYVREQVLKSAYYPKFYEALLRLAAIPDHPYNARRLHEYLLAKPMPLRDRSWSLFLHQEYGRTTAVDSLLDWALNSSLRDVASISDESLKLAAVALAWFLTSSNRFVRDRATKELVSLLQNRVQLVQSLLELFENVDDPYILERLYAVAYGCALRNPGDALLGDLAQFIYRVVFAENAPYPHILLRDYARGAIEFAYRGTELPPEMSGDFLRPPYKSPWPTDFPTEQDVRELGAGHPLRAGTPQSRATSALHSSVLGMEDFARYIIGTNSHDFFWSADPISKTGNISLKERVQQFVSGLTPAQAKAQRKLNTAYEELQAFRQENPQLENLHEDNLTEMEAQILSTLLAKIEEVDSSFKAFMKALGKRKGELFKELALAPEDTAHDEATQDFDIEQAQRWTLKRVYELGWSAELFGEFDSRVNASRIDRTAHKAERMGKKYQWLAWHEFLARAADNLNPARDYRGRLQTYVGPWQLGRRDIDPSCLLSGKPEQTDESAAWWVSHEYSSWDSELPEAEWLKQYSDLPDMADLILRDRPSDGSAWLLMDTMFSWEEPVPAEEEPNERKRRTLWVKVQSYIVQRKDAKRFYSWALKTDFSGRWMPESQSLYDVFLGEFHWAPAYSHNVESEEFEEWRTIERGGAPCKVLVPTLDYSVENQGFDCSVESSHSVTLPTKWLADKMGLKWGGIEGEYLGKDGKVAAYDPSAKDPGPTTLLIARESLVDFLESNEYEVVWTVLGEKQITPAGYSSQSEGWLSISGAYRLQDGRPKGQIKTSFKLPARRDD